MDRQRSTKREKALGAGLEELPFLNRAADVDKGKQVFLTKCQSCHGENGQGVFNHDSSFYIYPPLWGPNSYNKRWPFPALKICFFCKKQHALWISITQLTTAY
jgi:Cytochrome c